MPATPDERTPLILAAAVALVALASMRFGGKPTHGSAALAAMEPGRGRHARRPHQIPARGWKDILLRVWKSIDEDRILAIAAGVAFFGLLAIFPAIAALVSLYGFFADPAGITRTLDSVAGLLPAPSM
jgi:membrane protein